MMNLAARSCQGTYRATSESIKKIYSSARQGILASTKYRTPSSVVSSVKKQSTNRVQFSQKKDNCPASALKARKLLFEANNLKSEKIPLLAKTLEIVSVIESSESNEQNRISSVNKEIVPSQTDDLSILAADESTNITIVEASLLMVCDSQEIMVSDKDNLLHNEYNNEVTPGTKVVFAAEEGHTIEKENCKSLINEAGSPPISTKLGELSNTLKLLYSSTPAYVAATATDESNYVEPRTPERSMEVNDVLEVKELPSPWEKFSARSTGVQRTYIDEYINILNTAGKEDLKRLKGIGEKRATYILELREETPEPFKSLDDLKDIGLSAKQVKGMIKKEIGQLFN